jgi:TonB-linked SusC/RagA family outer membrane protein
MILMLAGPAATAQVRLRGSVLNENDKSPVGGATITVISSGLSTATDSLGHFQLTVPGGKTAVAVTSIGFNPVNLTLDPDKAPQIIYLSASSSQLAEVLVSTGYQQLPRERATGSFTQVSKQQFNQQVSTNVLQRLEAITNGLQFDRSTGADGKILIRGLSTISGPASPLVILDNFPYEGDLNNINPNDVESITLLKDAAAASIWGTRAGNGVIVITTKKGHFNQPITVELNTNVTVGQKPGLGYVRQMSGADYIGLEKFLFDKGYYDGALSDVYGPPVTPVVELLNRQRNGSLSAAETEKQLNVWRGQDVRNDFNKYFYRRPVNQQYALQLNGGGADHSWLISAGWDKNISELSAKYDRASLRFSHTIRLKDLRVTTGMTYTQSNSATGQPAYGQIQYGYGNLYPYARLADENGQALPVVRDYRLSYIDSIGKGKLLNWKYYPLDESAHTRNTGRTQDVVAQIGLNYRLPAGFQADVKYQYERQQTDGRLLQDQESFYTRDLINTFSRIDAATGQVIRPVPLGSILDLSAGMMTSHNLRGQLTHDRRWNKGELNVLAGAEVREILKDSRSDRQYGYNEAILTYSNADLVNTYPTFISGYPVNIPDTRSNKGLNNRYVSTFANAAYTWDQRYTLSVSGRRDASNLFGVNTNNKWTPLGSAGLAWNIYKEKFYQAGWLPYLKFRLTYGLSGNASPSATAVTTIRYGAVSPNTQTQIATFANYANPDLKWETSRMLNFGLDLSTRDNRLSGSVEYFRKNGTNLLGRDIIDYTAGVGTTIMRNSGEMSGYGLDVELNSLNTTGKFRWTSQLNFSFYKDKITKYYLPATNAAEKVQSSPVMSGVPGLPVYSVFAFASAGLNPENGNPRGYLNGQVSEDYTAIGSQDFSSLKFMGNAVPTVYGSLGNTLSWKNLSLTARLTYKFGYVFRRNTIGYGSLFEAGEGHSDFAKRWQKPGDEKSTDIPSMIYPNSSARDLFFSGSEAFVEKGDHIRLQYISLSYDLKKETFRSLPFRSVQVYLNASNLGILWRANKLGLDPEYDYSSLSIPPAKVFAAGIRINY